jgi:thiamine biosynthesis protein ThiS
MTLALPRLHAVTDDRVIAAGDVVARAAAMADVAGPALAVQLRARVLEGAALLQLARELSAVLTARGSWLVANDRADVARAARAQAVVSGRGGLNVADVRRVAPSALVARSVHNNAEARQAAAQGADFLMSGNVYVTASHPGAESAGLDVVRMASATGLRVIAIGGITPDRTGEVLAAGAFGIAAIRALWDAADPAAAAQAFLRALPGDESVTVVINGEARRARRGITLAGLLTDLALDARAVVVEHNRHIVRQGDLHRSAVADGDAIELVHFVGGG